ncbi:MAG: hypothetical protein JEY96_05515 [Bacteroidales bacterium]|nr:hypothetical protein [Bacteroidales bacterium]
MRYLSYCTFLIVLFSIKTIYSQSEFEHIDVISGIIIDDSNGTEIPLAHIFNESERTWVHAKENGHFSIWADINDTLLISAVGFEYKIIVLNDSLLQSDYIQIKLKPQIYEIGEATVKSLKNYTAFRQDILNLDLPKTELDSVSEELSKTSKEVAIQADYDKKIEDVFNRQKGTLFVLSSPFRSKTEKDMRKLKKIRTKEEEQNLMNQKYNREIVKKYTNLNENEIIPFMNFCNFSNEFILESNEYAIAEAINNKLEMYKNHNPIKN